MRLQEVIAEYKNQQNQSDKVSINSAQHIYRCEIG